MILSIAAEKAFDKIQYSFMTKTLKVGIEGSYLKIIKAIYKRPTANIILNVEKLRGSPKVRNMTRMPTVTTVIQYGVEVLASAIRQHKEIKGIQIIKEEMKLTLFTVIMILYVENSKDSTTKLLKLMCEFRTVLGYTPIMYIHQFIYTNNEVA